MKTKDNIHKIINLNAFICDMSKYYEIITYAESYIYSCLLIERGTHLYGFSFIIINYRVYSTHERPNIIT